MNIIWASRYHFFKLLWETGPGGAYFHTHLSFSHHKIFHFSHLWRA